MPDQDGSSESRSKPDGRSPAQIFLETELERCRAKLASWDEGVERMRDGQQAFDAVWPEIVRNAGRLYGKSATRDALEQMGRAEDAAHMY